MATGENNTTWGDVTNLNLGTALEEAIVGSADVTFASADVTLTLTDTNASQTARNMRLRCTGTTGGSTRNLIVPSIEKPYIVRNDCADSVVVKTAAGTGITVPAGKTMWVYSDATNVVDAVTHLSSLTLGTDLAVSDGGTGASTFTANGVIYGNTTSALLATAAGTTGQVLVGNTGGAPSWATLTGIGVTSFSGGTTGLTPNTATTGAITLAGTLGVANGGTGVTTSTGTVAVVLSNSPTLVTPTLGAASATSIANALGTVGAPSYTFTGDTNTGIYSPAADTIAFVEGGVEAMRISAIGDVLINTTTSLYGYASNPSLELNGVDGSTIGLKKGNVAGSYISHSTNLNIFNTTANGIVLATNNTERMRIDSAGSVGIGTTSPLSRLTVQQSADGFDQGFSLGRVGADRGTIFLNATSNTMNFGRGSNTNMTIDSSGNVGIGVTPSAWFTGSGLKALQVGDAAFVNQTNGYSWLQRNAFTNGSNVQTYISNGFATRYQQGDGEHIWQSAASGTAGNTISFSERMRIDSSGNVGIGTSSPGYRLDVTSGDTANTLNISSNSLATYNPTAYNGANARVFMRGGNSVGTFTGTQYTHGGNFEGFFGAVQNASNLADFVFQGYNGSAYEERVRINAAGNLLVGRTSGTGAKVDVYNSGSGDATVRIGNAQNGLTTDVGKQGSTTYGATGAGESFLYTASNLSIMSDTGAGVIKFSTGGNTERMRLDASGNLLVGTTTERGRMTVESASGNCRAVNVLTGASIMDQFFFNGTATGNISTNGVTASYNASSDVRLKKNITDADDAASLIDALQVRKFDWKANDSHQRYGFVAQELVEVAPEAVSQPADPDDMMGVDYSKLVPMLVKEIQSLRARVAQLEGK
jgi:hypothetical protein